MIKHGERRKEQSRGANKSRWPRGHASAVAPVGGGDAPGIAQRRVDTAPRVARLRVLQERANTGPHAVSVAQRAAATNTAPVNATGMPDHLKSGLEQLSGVDLSPVRVHYDSPKPAQLNAHAYTQGPDIFVGPGQERHLPHEGWHAVQQMKGRVRPTMQANGVDINDDRGLEREADVMGARALRSGSGAAQMKPDSTADSQLRIDTRTGNAAQRKTVLNVGSGTNPDNMMAADMGDTVLNIDSGHMELADLLMDKPVADFEFLQKSEDLPFKESAFEQMVKTQGIDQHESIYKQFIIRALFEKYPGREGFETMLRMLNEIMPGLQHMWAGQMWWLQEEQNFEQGFVENLSTVAAGLGAVDEIHAISALGFDLVKDPVAIAEMVEVLRPGGRLIITSEKTGMVSKALKTKDWTPVLDHDGKPVLRPNTPLLRYFNYLPDQSSIGGYEDVFKAHYPDMETSHTTGGGFGGEVPFVRLVFELKDDAKEILDANTVEEEDESLAALREAFNLRTVESEFDDYEFFS